MRGNVDDLLLKGGQEKCVISKFWEKPNEVLTDSSCNLFLNLELDAIITENYVLRERYTLVL